MVQFFNEIYEINLHLLQLGRMWRSSHKILIDWTKLMHHCLSVGLLLWDGIQHLVGDSELHMVPLGRTKMGVFQSN